MKYLVSACLTGRACRYDGKAAPCGRVLELARSGQVLPVCPEELGGLPVPREPAELAGDRVIARSGADLTRAFERGAAEALRLGLEQGCTVAVLKSRSPSCGCGRIYDGTFSGRLVPGDGVFARLAREAGLEVVCEDGDN